MNIFTIPQELVDSIETFAVSDVVYAPQKKRSETLECQTCLVSFQTPQDLRTHHKSDLHSYNLRRKLKNLSIVKDESEIDDESISSVDASDSEGEVEPSSPYVKFKIKESTQAIQVWRAILAPKQQQLQLSKEQLDARFRILRNSDKSLKWGLLMLGSGHFAGGIFGVRDQKAILHKSIHRYTTRRKQGGAQSSNDNSKGKAKSAGANLRRYNEMMLKMDIKALLTEWKSELKQCDLLFVRVSPTNKKMIFFDETVLDPLDPRVRTFPFTTRRPTHMELQRCLAVLLSVSLVDDIVVPLLEEPSDASGSDIDVNDFVEEEKDPFVNEQHEKQPEINLDLKKAIDLTRKGKKSMLEQHVERTGLDLLQKLPDRLGISFLHIAASSGRPEVVKFLLERGCSPLVRGESKSIRPYEASLDRATRDQFRKFMAKNPTQWDYSLSGIPSALTDEMQQKQEEKLRERRLRFEERQRIIREKQKQKEEEEAKKKQEEEHLSVQDIRKGKPVSIQKLSTFEKQSIGMSEEARAKLEREKRLAFLSLNSNVKPSY